MSLSNAFEIIKYSSESNIHLQVNDNKLSVDAPRAVISPEFSSCLVKYKKELIQILKILAHNQVTLKELKKEAAGDWEELQSDVKKLEAFSDAVAKQKLRKRGKIPSDYTEKAVCIGCGIVCLPPGLSGKGTLLGCVWCWNQIYGWPLPNMEHKQ